MFFLAFVSFVAHFLSVFSEEVKYKGYLTWYVFDDSNGGWIDISDPCIHNYATEDLGTYEHPSTFAGSGTYVNFKRCDKIYIPKFRKYFFLEDTCRECKDDEKNGLIHVDLYMGENFNQGRPVVECALEATTGETDDIIIKNPYPNYIVYNQKEFTKGVCHMKMFNQTLIETDPTCQRGIKITGANHSIVCCPSTCGTCGGTGCHLRSGGSANCCSNSILNSGVYCKTSVAPCIVKPSPDPTCKHGIKIAGANHSIVCCPSDCGTCGGTGCNFRTGGSANCCTNIILNSGISCRTSIAPCIVN